MESSERGIRIGEVLIKQGVLSEQQVFEIVQAQKETSTPFGVLAERLFDVTVESIEKAWIQQYVDMTGTIDLETLEIDQRALRLLNRRQAWQFEILPLRYEPWGEVLMAASEHRLARAVTFAASRLEPLIYFRVAESKQLRQFLKHHYPLPEISDQIVRKAMELVHEP